MKKLAILAAITVPLVACTTADPMNLGNGTVGYHFDCSFQGIGGCYQKANKVCPNGWTPIGGWHNTNNLGYAPVDGQYYPMVNSNIALTVVCK